MKVKFCSFVITNIFFPTVSWVARMLEEKHYALLVIVFILVVIFVGSIPSIIQSIIRKLKRKLRNDR